MIAVVDSGLGNVGSVLSMLKKLGHTAAGGHAVDHFETATHLILPGVGSFDSGMARVRDLGLVELLHEHVRGRNKPLLGICLGMQMLMERSEEGSLPGLAFIPGEVRRIAPAPRTLRVPHMGWAATNPTRPHPLFEGLESSARFYFAHSYAVSPASEDAVLARTDHGGPICAAVEHGRILGVQFHPEKSHKYGMRLLDNFARMS